MPRVPVRADTYTGMKRLSSFGFVPQSGQGSVEKRAKPSETFRRDQQQPPEPSPSEPQQLYSHFADCHHSIFSRIMSFGFGYTRDGTWSCSSTLWLHPLRVCEMPCKRALLALEGSPRHFRATRGISAKQPLVPDWPVWNPPYRQPGYAPVHTTK